MSNSLKGDKIMSKQIEIIPIIDVVKRYGVQYASDTCLLVRNQLSGVWNDVTWQSFAHMVEGISHGIVQEGCEIGDRIGIFSENSMHFLATYLAGFSAGVISIPCYASSSASQVRYIVEHSRMRLLFVGEQSQYNAAWEAVQGIDNPPRLILYTRDIERVGEDRSSLYFEDFVRIGRSGSHTEELARRREQWHEEQTALILYTSGTSGQPKGVELTFTNVQASINQHAKELDMLKAGKISMNFLPLTHIFELMWCLVCLTLRVRIAINKNPKKILRSLAEVRPHYMCNVPRFWEKVYVGVYEKIQSFPKVLKWLTDECIKVSKKYHFEYRAKGLNPPLNLKMRYYFYSKTLLMILKKKVGVDRGLLFPVAGAALADKVHAFLLSISIPIVYGYGLTETTATVCYCHPRDFKFGSIGKTLDCVSVKIDEEAGGEILVKGPTVTKGYYLAEEENRKAFTTDGWFRTGDLGSMDESGNIFFKERAKDLFKTANGKYIVPNVIENLLTSDPLIEQAVVIADGRSFVSALIYPNFEKISALLADKDNPVVEKSVTEWAADERVYHLLEERIAQQLSGLASFETVKKFHILTEPLSIDNGLLTNSLKTKRLSVEEYYQDAIRELYSYHQLPDLTK